MAEELELAQLFKHHRVAEVDVRGSRVNPEFDTEGAAEFESFEEFLLRKYFCGSYEEVGELLFWGHYGSRTARKAKVKKRRGEALAMGSLLLLGSFFGGFFGGFFGIGWPFFDVPEPHDRTLGAIDGIFHFRLVDDVLQQGEIPRLRLRVGQASDKLQLLFLCSGLDSQKSPDLLEIFSGLGGIC